MKFVDTHCHIHSADYPLDKERVIANAREAGVEKLICVGTDEKDSEQAVFFAKERDNIYASVGLHPHDAKSGRSALDMVAQLAGEPKVVAVGECGLDFYYNHSPKKEQIHALEYQLDLAQKNNLPLILHVRGAFADFWPVFDQFKGLKGVVHSFTANTVTLEDCLKRDLFIGLNGIMTFTKEDEQLEAAKNVPLNKLLLETDSPFLTPKPQRGKVNEPKKVVLTAEFLAALRKEKLTDLAAQSTANAKNLFRI